MAIRGFMKFVLFFLITLNAYSMSDLALKDCIDNSMSKSWKYAVQNYKPELMSCY